MTVEIAFELSDDLEGFLSEDQVRHYYVLGEEHYQHAMDKQWRVIFWLHGLQDSIRSEAE